MLIRPEIPPGHSLYGSGLLFLFNLFRISAEVEITHDLPWMLAGDGAMHAQDFLGQHLPYQTRRVNSLLIARDGNVHTGQRRICVTQSNARQVNVRCL